MGHVQIGRRMMAITQSKRSVKSARSVQKRLRLTVFPCMLVILLAGVVALLWQGQHAQPTHADASNVVGPPTLPASTVNQILAQTPMAGTGAVVEAASRQTNIDDAFALGVWWTETNDGAAGVGLADRNPGSVRGNAGYPAAFDGYTIYPSYSAAIVDWFNLLRSRYVNQGLTSVYTICRPYVGTASAYQWAAKVVNLMVRYHAEAPASTVASSPTVASAPTARPKAVTQQMAHSQHRQTHVLAPEPATQGTTQEVRPFNSVPDNRAPAPVAAPQALATPADTFSILPFAMLFGLLAALAIALWGFLIRKSIPSVPANWSSSVAAAQTPSTEALPALYANQFSPVLTPQPVVSTEELSQRELPPVPALAGVASAGLLRRYTAPDLSPHFEREASYVYAGAVQPPATSTYMPVVATSATPYAEKIVVPETPVPATGAEPTRFAGVRRGGLLRRYALEKADQ
jgi:hypothetical protein